MEPQEYDNIIRNLVHIAAKQDLINDDLRAMLQQHDAMLRNHDAMLQQQQEFNQDVKTTLADIKTLLTHIIPQGENGRDA